jgi:hypothetical protein
MMQTRRQLQWLRCWQPLLAWQQRQLRPVPAPAAALRQGRVRPLPLPALLPRRWRAQHTAALTVPLALPLRRPLLHQAARCSRCSPQQRIRLASMQQQLLLHQGRRPQPHPLMLHPSRPARAPLLPSQQQQQQQQQLRLHPPLQRLRRLQQSRQRRLLPWQRLQRQQQRRPP